MEQSDIKISELDNAILLLLKYAKEKCLKYLSEAQIQKVIYRLQEQSLKYAGEQFTYVQFTRQERGPVSFMIQNSLGKLRELEFISFTAKPIPNGKPAGCYSIAKEDFENILARDKAFFAYSTYELLFKQFPNFLNGSGKPVTLGSYETEPMKYITQKESTPNEWKGKFIDLERHVTLSPNISDIMSSL
jgi:hypothetical protein